MNISKSFSVHSLRFAISAKLKKFAVAKKKSNDLLVCFAVFSVTVLISKVRRWFYFLFQRL